MLVTTFLRSLASHLLFLFVSRTQTCTASPARTPKIAGIQTTPPTHHGFPRQRSLRTMVGEYCTAYGIDDDAVATTAYVEPNELSVGMDVVNILTGKRPAEGEVGQRYEDALDRMVVEYCQESPGSVRARYVTSENITAAKNQHGECIQTVDGDPEKYAAGFCEVVSNCYWDAPTEGQERTRRYTDAQYDAYDDASREHIKRVVVDYGTPGLVLAVVVFIGCIKFAIMRVICRKCLCDGDLQRERVGYTATEQWTPVAVFVIGLVVVSVAAWLGLTGDENVSGGLQAVFTTIDEAYDGVRELTSAVSLPLSSFLESLDNTTAEVESLLARAEGLSGLDSGMSSRLDAFENAYGHLFEGRHWEFDALGAGVVAAGAVFASRIAGNLSVAINVLEGDFVALEKVFVGVGNNVHAALEVTNGTAAKNRERLQYFRKLSNEYTDVRRTGILALLASFVAAGAIGFVGVSAGISTNKSLTPCVNLLRVTCTIVSVNTWIAFALSAVSMVTAVAWSHGCHFLDVGLRDGWAVAGLDGQSSAILDGCIGSGAAGSVFDVFNFTERLGFVESYADVVAKLEAVNETAAAAETLSAIYALTEFVDSLNSTEVRTTTKKGVERGEGRVGASKDLVLELDFDTDGTVRPSLLLDTDCSYNLSLAHEYSVTYLGRSGLIVRSVTASATTPGEAGGMRQSFDRQELFSTDESAVSYMSRVFNSSNCSLNDDLLSAWDGAAHQRITRDQMKADLVCIPNFDATDESDSTYCSSFSSGNSVTTTTTTTTTSISSSDTAASSSEFPSAVESSTSLVSSCRCTSENYSMAAAALGVPDDTLLDHYLAFKEQAIEIRNSFIRLYNLSSPSLLLSSAVSLEGGMGDDNVKGTLGSLATSLISARCASRCSFIADYYKAFDGGVCVTVLSGLAQVGVAIFLSGVGGLTLLVAAGIAVHRLKAEWGNKMAKVLSIEEGIVMEDF